MGSHPIASPVFPQSIHVATVSSPVMTGHLKLGGSSPKGETLAVNSFYMTRNGQPFIPVMGEFHFSRYPAEYWEEELLKIKAGGIDIVATYVFWIHIEEEEGVFDWSGNNNLRRFLELCDQHGLQAVVRMGPFAHGECRNGGLPDWLYGRPFPVRSNDARYLAYVRKLYGEIAAQLHGLLFKDGGCVVGIQLENEYMHCGAPWEVTFKPGTEWVPAGSDGEAHILALKQIALDFGLDVPLYTCTGWLRSPIPQDEILPMQGGYAFTPWSPNPHYIQLPTREFLFRNRHLNPVLNGEPTYDAARYPLACCEIGGGIQDTYYHRNRVPATAVESLAVMNLGGGANLIGYYMYHGGSNPIGKHDYLNEFTVPRISYDFQAPLREYGQTADSYRCLRLLHLFLHDFGDVLAPMQVSLPEHASSIVPEDTETLRYAVRSNGQSGFIFLNNYQDHVEMQDIAGIQLKLSTPDGMITIPDNHPFTLLRNTCAILPFGLSLDGIELRYATAQLLARIDDGNAINYFFFAPRGIETEYAIVSSGGQTTILTAKPGLDSVIALTNAEGRQVNLFTLTREQAEQACKIRLAGQERLVISEATVTTYGEHVILSSLGQNRFSLAVFPPLANNLTLDCGSGTQHPDGAFTRCDLEIPAQTVNIQVEPLDELRARVHVPVDALIGVNNVFLKVAYTGDMGNCFIDGLLVADHFHNGSIWEIGLKHLVNSGTAADLFLLITPIRPQSDVATYVPTGMAFRPGEATDIIGSIGEITWAAEYKIIADLP